MSLEALLSAIRYQGEIQARQIENQSEKQVDEILAAARREATRLREQVCTREVKPAYKERARIIHQAHLESLKILGEAREDLIDAAFNQARERLINFRDDPRYPPVLEKLIREAMSLIEATEDSYDDLIIELDPRDRAIFQSIKADLGLKSSVKFDLNCWGGVILRTGDDSIVIINTLEARLERATPFLRGQLAILFEQGLVNEVVLV